MTQLIGVWNKDGLVSAVKVLKDIAKNTLNIVLNIVLNNVNRFGRTFITALEALHYPAERIEFFTFGANLTAMRAR